ncbi:dehydratase [Vibrio sp. 10N.286.49.C2]|uniref:MaoC family dehydratase n=1 Tax=unclassified Vibrio TaxID=2614977 RepID=UPI000C8224C7|nr:MULTISPECIES: MaoC family dehydratase [unclassified Vibrio]PMH38322.1 dehydratase [Vibrio sp. 10N.286.49.C2]PMH55730.1 dehydratase [Vibrio sp. 10N.286.49.B1]PMH80029.1 dehydratase [Vibrio sp. 10N.286.48.B7]
MKVVKLFKQSADSIKHQSELMQWMSPALREYWSEFVDKTQNRNFLAWVRDYHKPAVNEPDASDLTPEIVLKPDAQKLYLELQDQIGTVIHEGDWLNVGQDRINQFGLVTEDNQWIHTDPERAAAESPFKTTIAHGFLTLSLLPALTDSVDANKPMFPTAKMMVNIGLNQVRFPYPVKAESNLRAKSTLLKVTPIRKGLEIEREIRVEIEGVRRPACIAVSVIHLHF